MPIAKQAKVSKTSSAKCFSLVPAAAQQQMYQTIAALRAVTFSKPRGTEIAQIAIRLAIGQQDPVIVCQGAHGARAVGEDRKVANSKRIDGRLAAGTISAVTALVNDGNAIAALVCVGPLQAEDDYRRAFSFAAQYKLPVLYLVANSLTPGRRQALDLRTLYAEFGIPVFSVEANDAIAAYRVATEALHNARHGRGPCVIEALTLDGHGVSKEDSLRLLRTYMERHDNWPL